MQRHAFTLIELMVAIALGALIIVVAYLAFGSALRTLATMNRLAAENALLRTGYFAVSDDADFWHSQANPDFPYLKGYMSDEVLDEAGANNPNNKRLFRPVAFPKSLDDPRNPNWQQPNDRRAWYRNGMSANVPPLARRVNARDSDRAYAAWETAGSASLAGGESVGRGWHPWHIYGDYAATANLAMDRQARPTTSTDDAERGAKPVLMWELFKQLGQHGVMAYSAPGTINLILRPSDNLFRGAGAITDESRHFDKGEVPWSLGAPEERPGRDGKLAQRDGTVRIPAVGVSGVTNGDNHRGNYASSMAAYPFRDDNDTNNGFLSPLYPFAADLELCVSDVQRGTGSVVCAVYATRPVASGFAAKTFDFGRLINARTRRPFGELDNKVDIAAYDTAHTGGAATTWLVPVGHTDAPAPPLGRKPASTPGMSVSVFRYRLKGDDKALCSVRVADDAAGQAVQLRFMLTTTTFRGARQHWGWRSQVDAGAAAIKDMGDSYQ